MRVLVCGGRGFNDRPLLDRVLNDLDAKSPIDVIIEGCAKGADHLAFQWANNRRRGTDSFPADWDQLGRKAGPLRNAAMLRDGRPDLVVAFPGGKGTTDMIERTKRAGVRLIVVAPDGQRVETAKGGGG